MTVPEIRRPLIQPLVELPEGAFAAPVALPEPASALAVDVIDDGSGLEALREEWDELVEASDAGEIFLTWEWLATWWRHLGAGRRPALYTVRDGGRLIALAPWAGPAPGARVGAAALRFLGSGVVGSDYLDLVVRRGESEAAIAALAERLDGARPTLELVQVRTGDSAVAALAGALERRGWWKLERATHLCPWIELDGRGWDAFVGALGPSHRANLRRRIRQAERTPGFAFRRAATPEEVESFFDVLVDLHRKRWRGRGGSDALMEPAVVAFHREFCRLALGRGWLRLYVLELEGKPVAALYALRYRHRFLFYQSGFDPAHAGRSVGLVCLALSLRAAMEEGATEYDLLHGAESYKFLWARRCRSLSRFELHPPTPGSGIRHWLRRGVWLCKDGLRRSLAGPQAGAWQMLGAGASEVKG